jgi:hypothetical protein
MTKRKGGLPPEPKPIERLTPDDPRHIDHPSHKEQWDELARAMGRALADRDFKRLRAFEQAFNALCPLPKAELRQHLERLVESHPIGMTCDEIMAALEQAPDPIAGVRMV